VALALAKAGYDIAVHHSHSAEQAERTFKEVRDRGVRACILQGDTGDVETPARIVRECIEQLGRLDVLVNNAGITRMEPLLNLTAACIDEVYRVDFRGMILCASEAAKYMVANKIKGNIIFNTSIRSVSPHGNDGVYGALKAGLNRIIQSFAVDMGKYGIRVNGFAPGVTNVWQPEPELEKVNFFYGYSHRFIPLRRNGYAEDMGGPVVWLCSDDAAYITGQVIHVDGGLSAVGKPETFFEMMDFWDIADAVNVPEGARFPKPPDGWKPPEPGDKPPV
jgi:glucose 1-dehydrogenase